MAERKLFNSIKLEESAALLVQMKVLKLLKFLAMERSESTEMPMGKKTAPLSKEEDKKNIFVKKK